MTGIDINGDGVIGQPRDVPPRFPGMFSYPNMGYGGYMYPAYGYGYGNSFHRYM